MLITSTGPVSVILVASTGPVTVILVASTGPVTAILVGVEWVMVGGGWVGGCQ